MRVRGFWIPILAALATPGVAAAGEYTEIASALDDDDPFDLHVTLSYGFEGGSAAIKREFVGHPSAMPGQAMPIVKDLVVKGSRHTITPTIRVGVMKDLELSLAIPYVIVDSYTLELDQRGDCIFPGPGVAMSTCIDRTNSSTIIDGLLGPMGFDANDPTGPGFIDEADPTIFRGTKRSGLDQIHLGVAWAPMNQARDSTKPTWKLGLQLRLAAGDVMRFDREDPSRHTGVSRGLHEIRLWTSVAKRVSWAEPFVELWWLAPFGKTSDSQFIEVGFGAEREGPQQHAGTRFGFEGIIYESRDAHQRVGLEFSTRLEAHFEGRAYSPMWEVFAYAGSTSFGGPLVLDADPEAPGVQNLSHPGVTNVENYLTFAGRLGLNARIGEKVDFGASFELLHDQQHYITFADAGVDLPRCQNGGNTDCEAENNETVDPNTVEVNPYHKAVIDSTGHRYRVEEDTQFVVLVSGTILF